MHILYNSVTLEVRRVSTFGNADMWEPGDDLLGPDGNRLVVGTSRHDRLLNVEGGYPEDYGYDGSLVLLSDGEAVLILRDPGGYTAESLAEYTKDQLHRMAPLYGVEGVNKNTQTEAEMISTLLGGF